MSTSPLQLRSTGAAWNRFFFASMNPQATGVLRAIFGTLVLISLFVLLPDLELWFGEHGALSFDASRQVIDSDTLTLFQWLPRTDRVVRWCFTVFLFQTLLLTVGLCSRLNAASVFVWLCTFHHRNIMIVDGEDTVFRMFAFLLALAPCGCSWSLDRLLYRHWTGRPLTATTAQAWPLRLIQIEMTLIYLSTAWEKLNGVAWLDGTALYYVSRLDDMWGRFPVPDVLFDSLTCLKLMTWSVLAIEVVLPFAFWFRETRRAAIVVAIALHLGIEYAMNLFLFEWIMILGVMSFVDADDMRAVKQVTRRLVACLRPAVFSARPSATRTHPKRIPVPLRNVG